MTRVTVKELCKDFGSIAAVRNLSFTVERGEVLGFLGPNGAGKSTTMKMITGFLEPTAGNVAVNDIDVSEQPLQTKAQVGYLPEGAPCYGEMTVQNFLRFIAEIRGYHGSSRQRQVAQAVERVHLQNVLYQTIDTLSKGYKRRVGLAQAILHDPPVLIMDEPTDGLDPNQKNEVRMLIQQMARDKAIIISTHILEEVDAVCTRAIMIVSGQKVFDGTPAEFTAQAEEGGGIDSAFRTLSAQHYQQQGNEVIRS